MPVRSHRNGCHLILLTFCSVLFSGASDSISLEQGLANSLFLYGLQAKYGIYISEWFSTKIKRKIMFPETWKVFEIDMSVSTCKVLLEQSHAVSMAAFGQQWQI